MIGGNVAGPRTVKDRYEETRQQASVPRGSAKWTDSATLLQPFEIIRSRLEGSIVSHLLCNASQDYLGFCRGLSTQARGIFENPICFRQNVINFFKVKPC